jgi:hypothetical protein
MPTGKQLAELANIDAFADADTIPVRDASDASELKEGTASQLATYMASELAPTFEASGVVSTHAAVTSGVHGISAFAATVLDDANAAAARTTLGAETAGAAATAQAAAVQRANHTGTQLASTISDFSTAVAATAAVTANTAKVTNATHTGDVTGATALTIANDAVTNAKAANMAASTIKGRVTASTGDPEDLTPAQARTVIASDSGGGTSNFLRADGTWAAPAGGGGSVATDTIFDAKGDLPVGTGADTAAKLTVGSNGRALVADSTPGTGLSWATSRLASDNTNFGIPDALIVAATGGVSRGANEIIYEPFVVYPGQTITISQALIHVNTAASAGNSARLGVCSMSGFTPGSVVADWGTVAVDSTGEKLITGLSTSLLPGEYAFILWTQATTTYRYTRCATHLVTKGADWLAVGRMAGGATWAGSWPSLPAANIASDASTPGWWRHVLVRWS